MLLEDGLTVTIVGGILVSIVVGVSKHMYGRINKRILSTLSHYLGTVKRRRQGLACPLYECLGGIIVPLHDVDSAYFDMAAVPDWIYKAAEAAGRIYAKLGRLPDFDFKVQDGDHIYRICAEPGFSSHTLAFYRRPRLLS